MVSSVESPDAADSAVDHSVNLGARIRALRRKRKMTVNELAQKAGVSVGMVSQVERGIANPSLRILERLRLTLDIPLSDLLEADPADSSQAEHAAFVRRAKQRPNFDVGTVGLHKEMLSPHGSHDMQFMIIAVPPHARADEVLIGPGEKAGLVLEGRLILGVGNQQTEIGPGDSFQFDSMLPHFVSNPDATVARVLWIMNTRMPVAHL